MEKNKMKSIALTLAVLFGTLSFAQAETVTVTGTETIPAESTDTVIVTGTETKPVESTAIVVIEDNAETTPEDTVVIKK
ncbi:MAG: hypothetical protein H0X26_07500 [Alphaproteobacteria bacterium]|nr:hypothetical protein [Alphaproteobacteria bacterium]